ncbi:MAG: TIGR00725 family protein [Thermodesulfovibrio sp.]|nr:TIGR00725 family protein [Spirochaetota bacterium]MCX7724869.1 TIGR00725 family protein [Thermodesulfovibrio sp.]MDW8113204.1 TIGR00725 family protein [Spirochaetia bacterium]
MKIIGVIGAGEAEKELLDLAEKVGRLLAKENVIVVTGGLGGVMEAACKGAYSEGGVTVGILPTDKKEDANPYVKIPIPTGMGEMRNSLIVRASDALIAIGGGYGTLSEIALALKTGKKVVGLKTWNIPGIIKSHSPEEAVTIVMSLFN